MAFSLVYLSAAAADPSAGNGIAMSAFGKIYRSQEKKFDAVVSVILGLVIWELVDSLMIRNPLVLVGPWRVAEAFMKLLSQGVLARHIYATFGEFILGYLIGVAVGVGGGILMALSRRAQGVLSPRGPIWDYAPLTLTAPAFLTPPAPPIPSLN